MGKLKVTNLPEVELKFVDQYSKLKFSFSLLYLVYICLWYGRVMFR